MSDPYKLRAMGLLVAAGFIGGLYLQYKAPGQFHVDRAKDAPQKKRIAPRDGGQEKDTEQENGEVENVPAGGAQKEEAESGSGPDKAAQDAKQAEEEAAAKAAEEADAAKAKAAAALTPPVLGKYAAIKSVIDNSIEITDSSGHTKTLYFATRGIVAEMDGEDVVARIWTREDDRLCQPEDSSNRKCFSFSVKLEKRLLDGPSAQVQTRIDSLPSGVQIGEVEGLGVKRAVLLRGNVRRFPDYVPLLEPRPRDAALLSERPADRAAPPSFVGSLLLHSRRDEDRAVTFFAPFGRLIEVQREGGARDVARLWIGAWRRDGDSVCRDLRSSDARRANPAQPAQECSPVQVQLRSVDFAGAAPARRSYIRMLWPDEERRAAEAKEQATQATALAPAQPTAQGAALTLGGGDKARRPSSFTDLR